MLARANRVLSGTPSVICTPVASVGPSLRSSMVYVISRPGKTSGCVVVLLEPCSRLYTVSFVVVSVSLGFTKSP